MSYPERLAGLAPRRTKAGYTQQQLADLLGVQRATLAMWEIGKTWPPARMLPSLAALLLCSIEELYQEEVEPHGGEQ